MCRRHLRLFAACSIVLAVGVVAIFLGEPRVRIDQTAFVAIRAGMNEAQIERILGGPPGDYRTGEVDYLLAHTQPGETSGTRLCRWVGDKGIINVLVGRDGRMVSATFYTGTRQPLGIVTSVRRRLGV
jgi:hypothetical protein